MRYTKQITTALVVLGIALTAFLAVRFCIQDNKAVKVVAANPVDPTVVTREFADKAMTLCKATLSPARREILLGQIVRVVHQRFHKEEDRQAFMALLCIESGFNPGAKSPVGAVGISQLMPRYGNDFAKLCGYQKVDDADLTDTETNLNLGACYFNNLLSTFGNTYLAIGAYNGGPSGTTVKNLKALKGGGPQETSDYINKVSYVKEEVNREKGNFVLRATADR